MPILTWGRGSVFEYEGCVLNGTTILFGANNNVTITAEQWSQLRQQFIGRVVEIGTSRDSPPQDSMGKWFYQHICDQALLSYIGVILVREHFAVR